MSYSQIEYEIEHGTAKRVLKMLVFFLVSAIFCMTVLIARMPEGHMKRIFTFNETPNPSVTAGHHLSILP